MSHTDQLDFVRPWLIFSFSDVVFFVFPPAPKKLLKLFIPLVLTLASFLRPTLFASCTVLFLPDVTPSDDDAFPPLLLLPVAAPNKRRLPANVKDVVALI